MESLRNNLIASGSRETCKYYLQIRLVLFILLLGSYHTVSAQEICLHGLVIESSTKEAIPNVHIFVVGEENGTISDSDGKFQLKTNKLPISIIASHLGYAIVQQIISDSVPSVKVELEKESLILDEVLVSANRMEILSDPDSLYIIDYVLYENYILSYGVVHKNPRQERLWLMSTDGQLLSYLEVKRVGRSILPEGERKSRSHYLFKDCFGEVHFFSHDKIWQLYIRNGQIEFLFPAEFKKFFSLLFPIKVRVNDRYFYYYPRPPAGYKYRIEPPPDNHNERILYWKKPEKTKPRPINPPIYNHKDTIILFNFSGDQIEYYSSKGIFLKYVPFDFHLHTYYDLLFFKNVGISFECKKEVLCDPDREKYYAVFEKFGIYSLHEVDIHSGTINKIIKVPDLPFIENIQVQDGIIYFLYTSRKYPNYRSLYRFVPPD